MSFGIGSSLLISVLIHFNNTLGSLFFGSQSLPAHSFLLLLAFAVFPPRLYAFLPDLPLNFCWAGVFFSRRSLITRAEEKPIIRISEMCCMTRTYMYSLINKELCAVVSKGIHYNFYKLIIGSQETKKVSQ